AARIREARSLRRHASRARRDSGPVLTRSIARRAPHTRIVVPRDRRRVRHPAFIRRAPFDACAQSSPERVGSPELKGVRPGVLHMSRCLTDDEIQAIADREAPLEHASHVEHCRRCAERLDARARLIARAVNAAGSADIPPDAGAAMRARLRGATSEGATTLRPVQRTRRWAWGIPLAVAAAIALFVYVTPGVDRRTTVSA